MDSKYATITHHMERHKDVVKPRFISQVDRSQQSSLQRLIMKAPRIQGEKCDMLLNKRVKWGINMLPEHTTYDERTQMTGVQQDERKQPAKRSRVR